MEGHEIQDLLLESILASLPNRGLAVQSPPGGQPGVGIVPRRQPFELPRGDFIYPHEVSTTSPCGLCDYFRAQSGLSFPTKALRERFYAVEHSKHGAFMGGKCPGPDLRKPGGPGDPQERA